MKIEYFNSEHIKIKSFSGILTVGELKSIINEFPDDIIFGFLNQPQQILEHRIYKNGMQSLVFQEPEK